MIERTDRQMPGVAIAVLAMAWLLALAPLAHAADVLLVDDAGAASPDVAAYYTDALDALGVAHDTQDTGGSDAAPGEPDAAALAGRKAVIWYTGDLVTGAGPGAATEAALGTWLDGGDACLLVFSQDYLFDKASTGVRAPGSDASLTAFMQAHLGLGRGVHDVFFSDLTGTGPHAGLGTHSVFTPASYDDWIDVLHPGPPAQVAVVGAGGPVAVAHAGPGYRTVVYGFGLELIDDPAARAELLRRALSWCGAAPEVLLVDDDGDYPNLRQPYIDALDALGVGVGAWDTQGGNDPPDEPAAADLAAADAVVWYAGNGDGPGDASETAIASYLDGGGCFLLSAQDYLWNNANGDGSVAGPFNAFMTDDLGLDAAYHDVSYPDVEGLGSWSGVGGPHALGYFGDLSDWSDVLVPRTGASVILDGIDGGAALRVVDGASRSFFLGFELAAVSDPAARTAILHAALSDCAIPLAFAPPDAFEDNDVRARAVPLPMGYGAPGAAVPATFHDPGDEDWYRFHATAGTTYTFEAESVAAGADAVLELFLADGTPAVPDQAGPVATGYELTWTAGGDGEAYVVVRPATLAVHGAWTDYALSAQAASTYSGLVTGHVYDAWTSEPIGGADVSITAVITHPDPGNQSAPTAAVSYSPPLEAGRYVLPYDDGAQIEVTVTAEGYRPGTATVAVAPVPGATLDVYLDALGLEADESGLVDFTGPPGGPFAPTSQVIALGNGGTQTLDYSAYGYDWVDVSPDYGTLGPGESVDLVLTVNAAAEGLPPGYAYDYVEIYDETTYAWFTDVEVRLLVEGPGALSVSGSTGYTPDGPVGGPFAPASRTYTVENTGGAPIDYIVTGVPAWLDASSPLDGTLGPGEFTGVILTVNVHAATLPDGFYPATLAFANVTNGAGDTARALELEVIGPPGFLEVAEPDGLDSVGPERGPFDPASRDYTVTNTGPGNLYYEASADVPWVEVQDGAGVLGTGEQATVTVALEAATSLSHLTDNYDSFDEMVIHPDGEFLYADAGGGELQVFIRDPASGSLTRYQTLSGGLAGVTGLTAIGAIAVSPDGRHVYVASYADDAVAAFSVSPIGGVLLPGPVVVDGGGADGLEGAEDVVVSPDGAHVYVAASVDSAVTTFARDPVTGALTFVAELRDEVDGTGLGGVQALAMAADGSRVYAAAPSDDRALLLFRDGETGTLSYNWAFSTDLGGGEILTPTDIATAADGVHVYVLSAYDSVLAVFDMGVGELDGVLDLPSDAAQVSLLPDESRVLVRGSGSVSAYARDPNTGWPTLLGRGDRWGPGCRFEQTRSLTVSPDGEQVYVSGVSYDNYGCDGYISGDRYIAAFPATIGADAGSLVPGAHAGTVSFVNTRDGGGDTTRPVSVQVDHDLWLAPYDVLLVDDSGGSWPYSLDDYEDALWDLNVFPPNSGSSYGNSVSIGVHETDADEAQQPTIEELMRAPVVVWFTGHTYTPKIGPGPAAEAALAEYLDRGGCVVISSQDYFESRGLTSFMVDRLGISSAVDDVIYTAVQGTGAFAGHGPHAISPQYNRVDRLLPGTGAAVFYGSPPGGSAHPTGVATDRTVYLGFPFESLPGDLERRALMKEILEHCGLTMSVDGEGQDDYENDNSLGQARDMTVTNVGQPPVLQDRTFHDQQDGTTEGDWVSFRANAGNEYTFKAIDEGYASDVRLDLFDDDGDPVAPDFVDDSGDQYTLVWQASTNGEYFVRATADQPGAWGDEAKYTLQAEYSPEFPGLLDGLVRSCGSWELAGVKMAVTGPIPKPPNATSQFQTVYSQFEPYGEYRLRYDENTVMEFTASRSGYQSETFTRPFLAPPNNHTLDIALASTGSSRGTLGLSAPGPLVFSGVAGAAPAPAQHTVVLDNTGCSTLEYVIDLPPGAPFDVASSTGNFSGVLQPPESVTLTFTPNAAAAALPVGTHATSLVFTNHTTGLGDTTLDVTFEVVAAEQADLSVTQTGPEAPVLEGAAIAYTLQADNAGPVQAEDVTLVGVLPAGATFVSAAGTGWTCGEAVGTVTCTRPDLLPGTGPPVTVQANAPPAAGQYQHAANVSTSTPDPDPLNDAAAPLALEIVAPVVDLSVSIDPQPEPAPMGQEFAYGITVRNASGVQAANAIYLDVTLPPEAALVGVDGDWSCDLEASPLACEQNDVLYPNNASTLSVRLVAPDAPTSLILEASVSADLADVAPGDNFASVEHDVGPPFLTYVGSLVDGVVGGLVSQYGHVISPDGRHVYVGSHGAIAHVESDVADGTLTFRRLYTEKLSGSTYLAMSDDGRFLYAASRAGDRVVVYERDDETGELAILQTINDGEGGIEGLQNPERIRFVDVQTPGYSVRDPGGPFLRVEAYYYAPTYAFTFSRDPESGLLALASRIELSSDVLSGVPAPGGQHFYEREDAALVVQALDPATGVISEIQRVEGFPGIGWNGVPVPSPDGAHVYVRDYNTDSIAVLSRDPATGLLSYLGLVKDGVQGADGLDNINAFVLSPDGLHGYATAWNEDAVTHFARDPATGALTYVAMIRDTDEGVDGLDGARTPMLLTDGSAVIVHGDYDNALTLLARDPATGGIAYADDLRHGDGTGATGEVRSEATSIATVPGSRHLYSTHYTSNDSPPLAVLERHPGTGRLVERQLLAPEALRQALGDEDLPLLENGAAVAVSSDGAHAYWLSQGSYAQGVLAVFERDPETGELTPVEVWSYADDALDVLRNARTLTLSPDGLSLYVGNSDYTFGGVAWFSRDPVTGGLTHEGWYPYDYSAGVYLYGVESIVVSPDGESLYATSWNNDAVTHFSRDPATGALSFEASYVDGSGIDGINGASAVAVAPDGGTVYVTGYYDNAVAVFGRDLATGVLTYQEVHRSGDPGVPAMSSPEAVAVSPSGEHVMVSSYQGTVTLFARDLATGLLTPVETHREGLGGVEGIGSAGALAFDEDGRHLYVGGDGAIAHFAADQPYPQVVWVGDEGGTEVLAGEVREAPTTLVEVVFSEPVEDPAGDAGADDVTNPSNYRLLSPGANATFETAACGAPTGDDAALALDAVDYEVTTRTASLALNGGVRLPSSAYRLLVCGSTTIRALDGAALDGDGDGEGGDDHVLDFTVTLDEADLLVGQSDAPDPVLEGQAVTYTATVTNLGPLAASAVTLTDVLPAGLGYVGATPLGGSCGEASGTVTCSLGALGVGATWTVEIEATALAAGEVTHTVNASAAQADFDATNSTASEPTEVLADSDADGLPDAWETEKFGDLTHDAGTDEEPDGLTNAEEYAAGTEPESSNSDGDWASDGEEVAAGTDPTDPNSYPPLPGPGYRDDVALGFDGSGAMSAGFWVLYGGAEWTWVKHNANRPVHVAVGDADADGVDEVTVDLEPPGLWVFRSGVGFEKVNNQSTEGLASGDVDGGGLADTVVDLGAGPGLWVKKNGGALSKVNGQSPVAFATGDIDGNGQDDIVVDFGPGSPGLWAYMNDTGFTKLNSNSPVGMAAADVDGNGQDDIVIDYGAAGLWLYRNAAGFERLSGNTGAQDMVVGDVDGNGQDDVLIDFGGAGLWLYRNGATFDKLNSNDAQGVVLVDLDRSGGEDVLANMAGKLWRQPDGAGAWSTILDEMPQAMSAGNIDGQ